MVVTRDEWPGESGPNQMEEPEYFVVRTADNTPPAFAAGFPAVDRIYFTAARLAFATTEPAVVSYIVLERSLGVTPTAEEVFGLSVRPRINAPVASSGTVNATAAAATVTSNATGLSGLTAYSAWAVAADYFGNRMQRAVELRFETLDDVPPMLQARISNVAVDAAALVVQLDEPGTVWYKYDAITRGPSICPSPEVLASQRTASTAQAGVIEVLEGGADVIRCARGQSVSL